MLGQRDLGSKFDPFVFILTYTYPIMYFFWSYLQETIDLWG